MWRFLFVDESGDAGLVAKGGSPHFMASVVEINDEGLAESRRHLAALRYFLGLHREMKAAGLTPAHRPRQRSCELLSELLLNGHALSTAVTVDKTKYAGPYLGTTGMPPSPSYFRNFVFRQLFERHFQDHPASSDQHFEIVFDRFTMQKSDLANLEQYLGNNWRLPTFEVMVHVDSRYVDPLYWPDLVVAALKDKADGVTSSPEERYLCGLVATVDMTTDHA